MRRWQRFVLVSLCVPVGAQAASAPTQANGTAPQSPQPAQGSNNSASGSTGQTPAEPYPRNSTKLEIVKSNKAVYPVEAERQGIQGEVVLKVLISEDGDVESAEVLSVNPILAKSALDAIKTWKFKPISKDGRPVKVSTKLPFDFYFKDKLIEKGVSADGGATSAPNTPLRIFPTRAMLLRQIAPVYPVDAKRARIEGHVILDAVIGKDGRIKDLKVISGPKELVPAALGAVQQWQYRPYLVMGDPVEVVTQITVNFKLNR